MKLGFGLYKNSLNYTNYEFVKQIGATHVVAHLTNYFGGSSPKISSGNENGWGLCDNEPIWDEELLSNLKKESSWKALSREKLHMIDPDEVAYRFYYEEN